MTPERLPIAWTIAGSDSGGQAGIQADLKTFSAMGVHGACAVTALTAQTPRHVSGIFPTSPDAISAQLEAMAEAYPPGAIKLGMLGSSDVVELVADFLVRFDCPIVVDPVITSTSGTALLKDDAREAVLRRLVPLAAIVTPNLDEARAFSGTDEPEAAARFFLDRGARAVLVKGGHRRSDHVEDFFAASEKTGRLSTIRVPVARTHGTGCTLASAIAAALARGDEIEDALVEAKRFLQTALRSAREIQGAAALRYDSAPDWRDLPWWHAGPRVEARAFAPCGPIGFYPIVDRAEDVVRLVDAGTPTVQLRVKDLSGEPLAREIEKAVAATRGKSRLFVNDFWREAIRLGAYGVHLGQEDLDGADITALRGAGIRLGVSTHSASELARAAALRPSYVAIGPIFPTTCKSMRFGPRGLAKIREWRELLPPETSLVAIGGLRPEHAAQAIRLGADGLAVLSDVAGAPDPRARAREWMDVTNRLLGVS